MSLDAFITRYGGWTEEFTFYNNEVKLRYDPKAHVYLLVQGNELLPQDGVTSVCHIIDRSEPLMAWSCKMMAHKLLATVPTMLLPTGDQIIPQQPFADFEKLVTEAKAAHKEKLEEAATVGHQAHAWIEQFIKAVLAGNETRKLELLAKYPEDERARNCCLAALQWMAQHNVRWRCTERKVYSRTHSYAGTMDGLALVDSCDDPLCCPHPFTDRLSVIDWKTSNYLYLEYLYQTAAYQNAYAEEMEEPVADRWVNRLGKDDGDFQSWHCEADDFQSDIAGFLCCLHLVRSVRSVKLRIKEKESAIKAELKARADAIKQAALKVKCKKADTFKGTRLPKCNGGDPCDTCRAKYEQVQRDKVTPCH